MAATTVLSDLQQSLPRQSIWYDEATDSVRIVDQTQLPHAFVVIELQSLDQVCHAIVSMQVRGAPLIGVTAAYGVYLALRDNPQQLDLALGKLMDTRPTAVNLRWALHRMQRNLEQVESAQRVGTALQLAQEMEREDVATCAAIGEHGAAVLVELWQEKRNKQPKADALNVLTHCNAGALATVAWGTALSVVYKAAEQGIPVHVWVDETRPRNQGAALSCWELARHNIPHTLIVDNAGGHLMQSGLVDVCVVGSDRTASNGDVCNKIGTYLKALSAADNNVPFYAALPVSTIDFAMATGVGQIPIEERDSGEVSHIAGADADGKVQTVRICPEHVKISNPAFDVTPARLVTGIITEAGVFQASQAGLAPLATQQT